MSEEWSRDGFEQYSEEYAGTGDGYSDDVSACKEGWGCDIIPSSGGFILGTVAELVNMSIETYYGLGLERDIQKKISCDTLFSKIDSRDELFCKD